MAGWMMMMDDGWQHGGGAERAVMQQDVGRLPPLCPASVRLRQRSEEPKSLRRLAFRDRWIERDKHI